MSRRLQVLLDEEEWREIRRAAKAQRITVAEWVRRALRTVRRGEPAVGADRKLQAVREAVRFDYPTGPIDRMLEEIERGYGDPAP